MSQQCAATFAVLLGVVAASDTGHLPNPTILEEIAKAEDTDKVRSMHKFTDLYASLFDSVRHSIHNVTEAGVLGGASVRTWLQYFPSAHVYGLDMDFKFYRTSRHGHWRRKHTAPSNRSEIPPRLTLLRCCDQEHTPQDIGLADGSMDLVLEDAGDHSRELQEHLFKQLWPLVRRGGWYLMEDVDPQRGGLAYTQNHDALSPTVRRALEQNAAFMVDTTVGITPAQWALWERDNNATAGPKKSKKGRLTKSPPWVKDRATHNSHVLVIRRLV